MKIPLIFTQYKSPVLRKDFEKIFFQRRMENLEERMAIKNFISFLQKFGKRLEV